MAEKYPFTNEEQELREIAPTLFSIKKENHFEVPENYFDSLPTIIQERVSEPKPSLLLEKLRFYLFRLALPTTFAVLVIYFGISYFNSGNTNYSLAEMTPEEINLALEGDGLFLIEENLLVETLMDDAVELSTIGEDSDSDEIIDYLIDNDIDLTAIVNEL